MLDKLFVPFLLLMGTVFISLPGILVTRAGWKLSQDYVPSGCVPGWAGCYRPYAIDMGTRRHCPCDFSCADSKRTRTFGGYCPNAGSRDCCAPRTDNLFKETRENRKRRLAPFGLYFLA